MKAVSRRKLMVVTLVLLVLLLVPATANAGDPGPCGDSPTLVDSVDIGNLTGETGHNLKGWGPVEPATSGGVYGNPGDGTCRVTWEPPNPKNGKRAASFTLTVPPDKIAERLELNVLDGLADDSFEVYVNNGLKYTYTGQQTSTENWVTHSIDLTGLRGKITVKIEATGSAWASFSTYGQLAVEWAKLYGTSGLDYVDIGNPSSEKGHKMTGWGPVEPSTSGGNWGSIAPGDCRVVWEKGTGDLSRSAYLQMKVRKGYGPATHLKLRVLDGQADDSYMVLVNHQLVHWAVLSPGSGETWVTHDIDLTTAFPGGVKGAVNVVIVAFGPAWSGHGTYGQVAFDWAILCP